MYAVFFTAVMLTLFRIIAWTMIEPFGGINQEAIHTLQSGFQILGRRQVAIGHELEMHEGIIENLTVESSRSFWPVWQASDFQAIENKGLTETTVRDS